MKHLIQYLKWQISNSLNWKESLAVELQVLLVMLKAMTMLKRAWKHCQAANIKCLRKSSFTELFNSADMEGPIGLSFTIAWKIRRTREVCQPGVCEYQHWLNNKFNIRLFKLVIQNEQTVFDLLILFKYFVLVIWMWVHACMHTHTHTSSSDPRTAQGHNHLSNQFLLQHGMLRMWKNILFFLSNTVRCQKAISPCMQK